MNFAKWILLVFFVILGSVILIFFGKYIINFLLIILMLGIGFLLIKGMLKIANLEPTGGDSVPPLTEENEEDFIEITETIDYNKTEENVMVEHSISDKILTDLPVIDKSAPVSDLIQHTHSDSEINSNNHQKKLISEKRSVVD